MKPNGIAIGLDGNTPYMHTTRATSAEDLIWGAVEEAIALGMTPRQFRNEAASAWEHYLREQGKQAVKDLT